MKCLEDIVGLKGVCDSPEALTYINDCIPLKYWSKLANSEDVNAKEFFSRCVRKASNKFIFDFLNSIKDAKWMQVLSSTIDGRVSDDIITCQGKVGKSVKKSCADPYVVPQVVSVTLYSKIEVPGFILFIEDSCGTEEIEVDIKCGENIININRIGDDVEIYFNNIPEYQFCSTSNKSICPCGAYSSCLCNNCFDIDKIGECDVFVICINCICSPEELLCKFRYQVKDVLKVLIEACYWEEYEITCRKNALARSLKKEAQSQLDKIFGGSTSDEFNPIQKRNSRYWPMLWALQRSIPIDKSKCIKCRQSYYAEQI